MKTRIKHPTDIPVSSTPDGVAVTPNGKTAFVTNPVGGSVSTIDVKTRIKHPTDIPVGANPYGVAVTPDGKTAFVTNNGSSSVSTIDVKSRTKHPTDIPVAAGPKGMAVTPDGKTAFVTNANPDAAPAPSGGSLSTIDVKTRTKHPPDIALGSFPFGVAVTPDGKTAFVTNNVGGTVSAIDVKSRAKQRRHPRRRARSRRDGHAGRQDRFRHQRRQQHGVDDRCEDQDQVLHRYPRRLVPGRGGDHVVSTVKTRSRRSPTGDDLREVREPEHPSSPFGAIRKAQLDVAFTPVGPTGAGEDSGGGSDAAVPVGSWGLGVRVGGRAGGFGPRRGVGAPAREGCRAAALSRTTAAARCRRSM